MEQLSVTNGLSRSRFFSMMETIQQNHSPLNSARNSYNKGWKYLKIEREKNGKR